MGSPMIRTHKLSRLPLPFLLFLGLFRFIWGYRRRFQKKTGINWVLYYTAETILDEMHEQMITLLQKHIPNVKEDMKQHIKQLMNEEYYLLFAVKW